MNQWYALYTKPNAEYQVEKTLQQHGIETYLPEIKSPDAHQKRKREPFFPCYLFIRADLAVIGLSRLQWTPGLRRIVAFGDRPSPMTNEVISLIQRKIDEIEATGGRLAHPFTPGDTVRITDGPLRDMLAIFDGQVTPSERVQVLLTFLGRASRMRIDVADLEMAPPDAKAPMPNYSRRTRGRGRRVHS